MLLGFGDNVKNFIKDNFDEKHLFDKTFLEEFRTEALKDFEGDVLLDTIRGEIFSLNSTYFYNYFLHSGMIFISKLDILLGLMEFNTFNRDYYAFNFFVSLLHETMHAYQNSIKDFSNDIFKMFEHCNLVRDGDISLSGKAITDKLISQGDFLYSKYHDLFFKERYAEMSSILFMSDIYEKIKPNNKNEIFEFKYYYVLKGINDYIFKSKLTSPLFQFYRLINRVDLFNKFDFTKYSMVEKFICGMPLKREDLMKECFDFVVVDKDGKVNVKSRKIAREIWRNR